MKRLMIWLASAALAATMTLSAHGPHGNKGQCPDANADGKCDRCGRAVNSGKTDSKTRAGKGHRHGHNCCQGNEAKPAAPGAQAKP